MEIVQAMRVVHSRLGCEYFPGVIQEHQCRQRLHVELAGSRRALRMIHAYDFHIHFRVICRPLSDDGLLNFARLAPSSLEIEELHVSLPWQDFRNF